MNHMTTNETFYCEECNHKEVSDCGNPLHTSEVTGKDLCKDCFQRELDEQEEDEQELVEVAELPRRKVIRL